MAAMEKTQRGFTLVELMVALSIVAILAAIAGPSFISVINRNRLATQANELLTAIQFSRMEAVRRSNRVVVCPTLAPDAAQVDDCASGQQPYWVVLARTPAGAWEQVRRVDVKPPVQVWSDDIDSITFGPDGMARDGDMLLAGSITVCMATKNPSRNKRTVNIASGSRVSVAIPDEDGEGECK
jgi:type IV fimbrial biogenesis protein FimT